MAHSRDGILVLKNSFDLKLQVYSLKLEHTQHREISTRDYYPL